ncbi:MAG: hypothetical protein OER97_07350 [Gammaproteobacteria bacterium]|nr:hypothetical protein [Gammaproteobacteria bacterium]
MPRLSAMPAILGGAIVFAVASWWLASIALQGRAGYADAATLSAQAASVAIFIQWLAIALIARSVSATSNGTASLWVWEWVSMLAVVLPFWPLLGLLWLTSKLSAITLVASQLIAVLLAALMLVASRAIASLPVGAELRQLLTITASVAVVAVIWLNQSRLAEWVSP